MKFGKINNSADPKFPKICVKEESFLKSVSSY